MEIALFALGSMGFWILAGAVCLLLIAAVEYEKPGWATISLIVFCVALWLFGDVNVIKLTTKEPLFTSGLLVGYFVVGVIWSLAKWWFFVRQCRERYGKLRSTFLKKRGYRRDGSIPETEREQWQEWLNGQLRYDRGYQLRPTVQQNKSRILTWMIYWPWSAVWTVLNDPVKRFFKFIFNQMKVVYQKIAYNAFKDVENDFICPVDDVKEDETS
jgi:hypothetical protein